MEKWPCFVLSDCLYQTNLGAIPVRPLCFTGMFGMFFICFHESTALPGFLGSRNRVWHVIQPRSYMKLFPMLCVQLGKASDSERVSGLGILSLQEHRARGFPK